MKKELIFTCLVIVWPRITFAREHTQIVSKPIIVQQQITNETNNDHLSNGISTVLSTIVPIVPSLVVLGKLIADKIKEKKEDKQNNLNQADEKKLQVMKQTLQQQRGQLQDITKLYAHYCRQELSPAYKKRLKGRSAAIKKLVQGNMRLVSYIPSWPYTDDAFMRIFDLSSEKRKKSKGVRLQQALAKEFYTMGEKAEDFWREYYEDQYIQQLIERSVGCIKKGIACNESGDVVKASLFADIGWAVLDHVHAIGEGMYQGAVKTVDAFLHPIQLTKKTSSGMKQFFYSLGHMTLDVIDFYMLAVKNPGTAQKKLYSWQQSFVALLNKISQEWRIQTSRDITKFIATFATERVATYGIYTILGKIFAVARANAGQLAQQKEVIASPHFLHTTSLVEIDERPVVESLHDMPQPLLRAVGPRYRFIFLR